MTNEVEVLAPDGEPVTEEEAGKYPETKEELIAFFEDLQGEEIPEDLKLNAIRFETVVLGNRVQDLTRVIQQHEQNIQVLDKSIQNLAQYIEKRVGG